MSGHSPSHHGFTLLELLVVVALLALLGTGALVAYEGSRAQAREDATRFEMAELRKALLQFRRDVGHFPDAEGNYAAPADLPKRMSLLWACQADDAGAAAAPYYDAGCTAWNRDTRRGWNGPYVSAGTAAQDAWEQDYQLLEPESDTPVTGDARLVSLWASEADGADDYAVPLVR